MQVSWSVFTEFSNFFKPIFKLKTISIKTNQQPATKPTMPSDCHSYYVQAPVLKPSLTSSIDLPTLYIYKGNCDVWSFEYGFFHYANVLSYCNIQQ